MLEAQAVKPLSVLPMLQQTDKPMPSPPAVADTVLNGKAIHITYNTPHMRGRVIFGGLVPYDHWWRTGANPATTFTTEGDLMIGTLHVPAGKYTLFTIPSTGTWQLILNKQVGQWGLEYHPERDLGRTPMKSKTLATAQEIMSISFEDVKGKTAELHIRWDKADEYVKVTAQ
jgi:hypothetical protein